jgi:hypothetical protein
MFKNAPGTLLIVFALSFVLLTSGCANHSTYWNDRKRDALDMVTLTAGTGGGIKGRVGPVQTGLLLNFDRFGLRSGTWKTDVTNHAGDIFPDILDATCPIIGTEICHWPGDARTEAKKFFALSILGFTGTDPSYLNPTGASCASLPYFTQVEVCGGLIGTLRAGINPGEMLDFLQGWATLDMYQDDTAAIQRLVAEEEAEREKERQRQKEQEKKKERKEEMSAP